MDHKLKIRDEKRVFIQKIMSIINYIFALKIKVIPNLYITKVSIMCNPKSVSVIMSSPLITSDYGNIRIHMPRDRGRKANNDICHIKATKGFPLIKALKGLSPFSIEPSPYPKLYLSMTRLWLGRLTSKGSAFRAFEFSNIEMRKNSYHQVHSSCSQAYFIY